MIASPPANATAPLEISLFGPFQVLVDGQPLCRLRSRKALWVLALLALRHDRPVEREWLAGMLWPEVDQASAFANLRPVLSELRRALAGQSERLQTPDRHTVLLALSGVAVDVCVFDAAVAGKNLSAIEQAVALYRGPLLEGCAEEWVHQERSERQSRCLQALLMLAEAAQTAGDNERADRYFRRAISIDPFCESAHQGLMETLANRGDINEALRVYRAFADAIKKEFNVTPDVRTAQLHLRLRAQLQCQSKPATAIAEPSIAPVVTGYLPHPLTALVGREDERIEIASRLRRSRLVTLTGFGGIGKTRLAIRVATEVAAEYRDGAWLVALESLCDGKLVAKQIASVLAITEGSGRPILDAVIDHLRYRRLLLVLDNCEQVLQATVEVAAEIIHKCLGVRILATSRESLGISGEVVSPVPPLAFAAARQLPKGRNTLVRVLRGYESVQLFVARAQAAQDRFMLTPENATTVASICAKLDGNPLAIELAAARVKSMTVDAICEYLHDHIGLTNDLQNRAVWSRQQTVCATLDWSYALLAPLEQALLGRLSVFVGGCTLQAAQQVCFCEDIPPLRLIDLLSHLVDKSLVVFYEEDSELGGRYRLLETVRQYASEKLNLAGMTRQMRIAHRDWTVAFIASMLQTRAQKDRTIALHKMEAEHDNFRAALAFCASDPNGADIGLHLATSLSHFWGLCGHTVEGRRQLMLALSRSEVQAAAPERAEALRAAGQLSLLIGEYASAQPMLEESLGILRKAGAPDRVASILNQLGNIFLAQSKCSEAQACYAEALELFRQLGNQRQIASTLNCLGQTSHSQCNYASAKLFFEQSLSMYSPEAPMHSVGLFTHNLATTLHALKDFAGAQLLFEECLRCFKECEDRTGTASTLRGMAAVLSDLGRHAESKALIEESVTIATGLQDKRAVAECLEELAIVLSRLGNFRKSACIWGAANAIRENIGAPHFPNEHERYSPVLAEVVSALDKETFAAAWAEGRALQWQTAAARAVENASALS